LELELLYEYQQQEINYDKLLRRISEVEENEKIKRLKDEYSRLKNEYGSLSTQRTEIEKEITQRKISYKKLQESKTNYEKLMYTPEINSMKKLETLKKQIEDIEKNMSKEKDNILELEKALIEVDDNILSIKKKSAFIKKKYETAKEENQQILNFLTKEKSNIEELLKELKKGIDDSIYNEYMKMKKRLNNPISEINDRKCSGCGMEVPAMDYECVKTGNAMRCQSCGRMLVYIKKNIK